jgi:hypothetical protein
MQIAHFVLFTAVGMALSVPAEGQTLSVVVRDFWGPAIPHAHARLLSLDRAVEAESDGSGKVEFNGVAAGTYDLEISANGFQGQTQRDLRIAADSSEPIAVTLRVGNQPNHCGFLSILEYGPSVPGTARLSGRVTDGHSSEGISGAGVELIPAAANMPTRSVVSDSQGRFAFADSAAGRYSIRARKKGYISAGVTEFLAPLQNTTVLGLILDKQGHLDVCQ